MVIRHSFKKGNELRTLCSEIISIAHRYHTMPELELNDYDEYFDIETRCMEHLHDCVVYEYRDEHSVMYYAISAPTVDVHCKGLVAISLLLVGANITSKVYREVMAEVYSDLRRIPSVTYLLKSRRLAPFKYLYEYKKL